MGLLDAIFSAGNSAKRHIRGLLADPMGSVEQTLGMLSDDRKQAAERNARMVHNPDTVSADDVQSLLGGGASFAPAAMTVWHGSPHKFSKFDMSKIGTGEGAQAYGHGLYMAEAPAVAQEYAKMTGSGPEGTARMLLNMYKDRKVAKEVAEAGIKPYLTPEAKAHQQKVVELLSGDTPINGSQLYKVDIPDEAVARMLDWDKPLSQQAPEVQKKLAEIAGESADSFSKKMLTNPSAYGEDLHKALTWLGDNSSIGADRANAAEILKKQGIPGIRYLDGGSRSAGQGSSNFVLFDDQLPRILEINGVPTGLQPWKTKEWQGLLGGGR